MRRLLAAIVLVVVLLVIDKARGEPHAPSLTGSWDCTWQAPGSPAQHETHRIVETGASVTGSTEGGKWQATRRGSTIRGTLDDLGGTADLVLEVLPSALKGTIVYTKGVTVPALRGVKTTFVCVRAAAAPAAAPPAAKRERPERPEHPERPEKVAPTCVAHRKTGCASSLSCCDTLHDACFNDRCVTCQSGGRFKDRDICCTGVCSEMNKNGVGAHEVCC